MEPLLQFGIDFIVRFQGLGDWLVGPMEFFSFFGSENFFLFVLPALYWCIDTGLGVRVGFILLASGGLNNLFKMAMHGPRPYWTSARVAGLASETGFGVPSGHAQIAAGVWGMIAARLARTWAWAAAIGAILLIGLSRLYLGVHFPHDVLVGWLLGGLTLWSFLKFWDPIVARLKRMSLGAQILSAFAVSAAAILIAALVVFLSRDFSIPPDWVANAARDGNALPDPLSLKGIFSTMGTFFGFGAGVAWLNARGGFSVSGPVWKRAARYVVGLAGVIVFYVGLDLLFPDGETLVPLVFRYVRYASVGFWLAGGAPWAFAKLQLTDRAN